MLARGRERACGVRSRTFRGNSAGTPSGQANRLRASRIASVRAPSAGVRLFHGGSGARPVGCRTSVVSAGFTARAAEQQLRDRGEHRDDERRRRRLTSSRGQRQEEEFAARSDELAPPHLPRSSPGGGEGGLPPREGGVKPLKQRSRGGSDTGALVRRLQKAITRPGVEGVSKDAAKPASRPRPARCKRFLPRGCRPLQARHGGAGQSACWSALIGRAGSAKCDSPTRHGLGVDRTLNYLLDAELSGPRCRNQP